jgi:glycosyltransferase involved in cell wall biosynthesis
VIVGDGDRMEALRAQAATLGVTSRVTFAGHRADVPAVLGALDVFCISSTYEGTPLALFEAMAAGKAIVSTAVDGCREVLEDAVTGLLVPPRDPAALSAALGRVLDDEGMRRRLGENARAASTRYDIRACVAAMESLYDEVLAERGLA